MKSKIYENLEQSARDIMEADGKCVIMAYDGKDEDLMMSAILHHSSEAFDLFVSLFSRFPEFIPKALAAASIVIDDDIEEVEEDDEDDEEEDGGIVCLN